LPSYLANDSLGLSVSHRFHICVHCNEYTLLVSLQVKDTVHILFRVSDRESREPYFILLWDTVSSAHLVLSTRMWRWSRRKNCREWKKWTTELVLLTYTAFPNGQTHCWCWFGITEEIQCGYKEKYRALRIKVSGVRNTFIHPI